MTDVDIMFRISLVAVPAFILHFRLIFRGNRYPDPQDDLRDALQYLRQHAEELGIDARKIGVMGFSAGGHLAVSSLELFPIEERPAFVASIYPVVTMTEECVHKRSRRGLLGDSRVGNEELRDLLSLERHIPADCPPVFLVNCKDDPVVDYRNSELLDSALTAQHIDHHHSALLATQMAEGEGIVGAVARGGDAVDA